MRITLKTLGVICIIVTALFIAACGDLLEADLVVTFDANGGTYSGQSKVPLPPKDNTGVSEPSTKPTKTTYLTEAGLYKNFNGYEFDGWYQDDTKFTAWNQPITSDITLTAKWKPLTNLLPSGPDDAVKKAVTYIQASTTSNNSTDNYTLVLDTNIPACDAQILSKPNSNLTITGVYAKSSISDRWNYRQISIKSNVTTGIFFTVGKNDRLTDGSTASNAAQDTSISLTLNSIILEGNTSNNSLIEARQGAKLTLGDGVIIQNHKNSTELTSGKGGNGSAVCVKDKATLTILLGCNITKNEATGTLTNRALVGGIYAIDGAIVDMKGGYIKDNECPTGHTKDVYVTEDVDLTIRGNLTIGELTLNADVTGSNIKSTVIKIPETVTNNIEKLCLRSTEPPSGSSDTPTQSLTKTKNRWNGRQILQGIAPSPGVAAYDIKLDDIARFNLAEFRGTVDFNNIDGNSNQIKSGYEIATSGDKKGYLVPVTTTP